MESSLAWQRYQEKKEANEDDEQEKEEEEMREELKNKKGSSLRTRTVDTISSWQ